ncbi:triacylglycerol lipase-like protein [Dothidotthia symphoricarpi CBS 119687]|uniref:Carboxylic ester hydrolase n=1 Tax=Dothidotthia symphoricarpi CBS 119687 TaxID=1392245 RepID=A0A6A6AIJ3_9PLEO|nr:triacylglycerol lipase-like protein [Dothidotthia symphoricarpi CBS 119687]KAF2130724.1 triacylglycerol lipase-like protein [Dothidotthia symphoricarpi CBS 119687]
MLRLLLCVVICLQYVTAVDTTVDLGYAKYLGKDIGNGILRWAGMRYARRVSRVDGLRFTAPQDPISEGRVMNATEFGALCIGSTSDVSSEFGGKWSEDCLFINVFAPAKATNESLLPVYFFIQGGGFNVNGNANYDGADLIDAADDNMVIVNFNYRVGPYGFLASKEIAANETLSLNNGLRDQRHAMKWVQKYIKEFGGNPDHVTLGGASAGGGSVVLQLTAYGGRNDSLFHAAATESAAFPPLRNVTNSQWQYDALLKQSGCADLACLTSLDAVSFQSAVLSLKLPFPGGTNPPIYFWNPTLDYDFIRNYTYDELAAGNFVKVPTIFGDSTNEGINFTPQTITSLTYAKEFVVDQFPSIEWTRIRNVWATADVSFKDMYWRQFASDIFGHVRYICPNIKISSEYVLHSTAPTWLYRWDVGAASHVGELMPIWHNASSAAGVFVQAYWASFIRSYDPNTYTAEFLAAKGQEIDNPDWQTAGTGIRMRFDDLNQVTMETVSQDELDKCDIVTQMGVQLERSVVSSDSSSLTPSTYMAVGVVILELVQWFYP